METTYYQKGEYLMHPQHAVYQSEDTKRANGDDYPTYTPASRKQISSVVISEEYLSRSIPENSVRYVEVPVIEEVVKAVPVKSIVEVEKVIPKYEVEYVDKYIEVPKIEYIDHHIEKNEIREVTREVPSPIKQIKKIPKEVIKTVPKIEYVEVEKIVEVPGEVIRVPKPGCEPEVRIESENIPVAVAQKIEPIMYDEEKPDEIDAYEYEPHVVPIDIHVMTPIKSHIKAVGTKEVHERVEIPAAQYNTILKQLNNHLTESQHQDLPFKTENGMIPFLLPEELPGYVVLEGVDKEKISKLSINNNIEVSSVNLLGIQSEVPNTTLENNSDSANLHYRASTFHGTPYQAKTSYEAPYQPKTSYEISYRPITSYEAPYQAKTSYEAPYQAKSSYEAPYQAKTSYDVPYQAKFSYGAPYQTKTSYEAPHQAKTSYEAPYQAKPSYETLYQEKRSYEEVSYQEKKSYEEAPYQEKKSYEKDPYEKASYEKAPYKEASNEESPDEEPLYRGAPYREVPYQEKRSYEETPYHNEKSYEEASYPEKKSYGEASYEEKRSFKETQYQTETPYDNDKANEMLSLEIQEEPRMEKKISEGYSSAKTSSNVQQQILCLNDQAISNQQSIEQQMSSLKQRTMSDFVEQFSMLENQFLQMQQQTSNLESQTSNLERQETLKPKISGLRSQLSSLKQQMSDLVRKSSMKPQNSSMKQQNSTLYDQSLKSYEKSQEQFGEYNRNSDLQEYSNFRQKSSKLESKPSKLEQQLSELQERLNSLIISHSSEKPKKNEFQYSKSSHSLQKEQVTAHGTLDRNTEPYLINQNFRNSTELIEIPNINQFSDGKDKQYERVLYVKQASDADNRMVQRDLNQSGNEQNNNVCNDKQIESGISEKKSNSIPYTQPLQYAAQYNHSTYTHQKPAPMYGDHKYSYASPPKACMYKTGAVYTSTADNEVHECKRASVTRPVIHSSVVEPESVYTPQMRPSIRTEHIYLPNDQHAMYSGQNVATRHRPTYPEEFQHIPEDMEHHPSNAYVTYDQYEMSPQYASPYYMRQMQPPYYSHAHSYHHPSAVYFPSMHAVPATAVMPTKLSKYSKNKTRRNPIKKDVCCTSRTRKICRC